MALTDKLRAIGDAIRAKTGRTAALTLDQMPSEINSIESGSSAPWKTASKSIPVVAETPDISIYIYEEA